MTEVMPITHPWQGHPMEPAFLGCVRWALGEPSVVERFREATGNVWTPGNTPIDRLVDNATGADREFMQSFVAWVAADIFGTPADLEEVDCG